MGSLARRITAIVAVALISVWLAVVVSVYLGDDWAAKGYWPTEKRVAAILAVIEATPDAERPPLLAALQSQALTIAIQSRDASASDRSSRRIDEEITKRYAVWLPDRAITVSADVPSPAPLGAMIGFETRHALEIRIGMKSGETLLITSLAPVLVTRFGLPTGVGAGILGSLIALGAISILLREMRPLRQLARAVDEIGLDGQTATLPDVRGQTAEIRTLVTAFDRLQTRLSQLLAGRMAMLGGISHDLRTFATRLRLRVDFIEDEQQRHRATKDISDMISLLDDALLATRVGSGDVATELLDVAAIVRGEVADMRAAGAKVSFGDASTTAAAMVLGDRIALRRVVTNLIDNALKYGHTARVTIEMSALRVQLTIDDDGPGIPVEALPLVTEPFVRGEASRSRDTGGSGLGLAVVRNLVEANSGKLQFANLPTGGLRVTVELPRYQMF